MNIKAPVNSGMIKNRGCTPSLMSFLIKLTMDWLPLLRIINQNILKAWRSGLDAAGRIEVARLDQSRKPKRIRLVGNHLVLHLVQFTR
ncbi:hypothetical protein D3C81_1932090 [compost metagenome]